MKSVLTAILLLTVTVGAKDWRIAALLTTAEKP